MRGGCPYECLKDQYELAFKSNTTHLKEPTKDKVIRTKLEFFNNQIDEWWEIHTCLLEACKLAERFIADMDCFFEDKAENDLLIKIREAIRKAR